MIGSPTDPERDLIDDAFWALHNWSWPEIRARLEQIEDDEKREAMRNMLNKIVQNRRHWEELDREN